MAAPDQFGWLQASATRNYSAAIGSEHPATIRIDNFDISNPADNQTAVSVLPVIAQNLKPGSRVVNVVAQNLRLNYW